MPNSLRTHVVAYCRTNPGEDADPEQAIETQRELIERYVAFRGLELARVIEDVSTPGSVPIEARPGGTQLLQWIEKPHVEGVVVVRLERLFSSAAECVAYHAMWQERPVVLHVCELAGNPVQTGTPGGDLMIAVLRAARDMEHEQQRRGEVNLQSLHRRKRGAKLLLGEKIVRGYVVPDPVEAHAVKRIEELAARGKSLRLIAEALDQEGIATKRRAKSWSKEAIRLILKRIEQGEVRRAIEVGTITRGLDSVKSTDIARKQ